jgi:phosphatidylserine decarboxylase
LTHDDHLDSQRNRVLAAFAGLDPLHVYSRALGIISRIQVPRQVREPVFRALASKFRMDLSEADLPLADYASFSDLFVRRLRDGARKVDDQPYTMISPVDGCISQLGAIEADQLIQAKGLLYSLPELLRDQALADVLKGGLFFTLYLRPKDYHRIHVPLTTRVLAVQQVAGSLFPVQPWAVRRIPGLFVRNERVVLQLDTVAGPAALVCVGASGVGSISTVFGAIRGTMRFRSPPLFKKGEEIAAFNLGSTVILVFAAGQLSPRPLCAGDEVRVGTVLADVSSAVKRES